MWREKTSFTGLIRRIWTWGECMKLYYRNESQRIPAGEPQTIYEAAEQMRHILQDSQESVSFFNWEFADQYNLWIVRWGNPDACFQLSDLPEDAHDQYALYEQAQQSYRHILEWNIDPTSAANVHSEEEKRSRGMYRDTEQNIDFMLSRSMRRRLEALEECYDIGAWYAWGDIIQAVKRTAENDLETGRMTPAQYDVIKKRYRI